MDCEIFSIFFDTPANDPPALQACPRHDHKILHLRAIRPQNRAASWLATQLEFPFKAPLLDFKSSHDFLAELNEKVSGWLKLRRDFERVGILEALRNWYCGGESQGR